MVRNISRILSVAVTFTALVLPIGTVVAQSTTPSPPTVVTGSNPEPQVVTGTTPEPQVILTIVLNILLPA
jgi:hypothetical protein